MTQPPIPGSGPGSAEPEHPEAETRMRRALGLLPGGTTSSRRQDSVAVEHRTGRGAQGINRVAQAETALAEERKRREQAERDNAELRAALHEAQTKRGHAELARDEAVAARDEAIAARDAALAVQEAHTAEPDDIPSPLLAAADDAPRRRGRPRKNRLPEPDDAEPVQWWQPGWSS
jgi:hypothetical protein